MYQKSLKNRSHCQEVIFRELTVQQLQENRPCSFLSYKIAIMSAAMLHESIWFDWPKYEKAESHYQRSLAEGLSQSQPHGSKVRIFYSSYV